MRLGQQWLFTQVKKKTNPINVISKTADPILLFPPNSFFPRVKTESGTWLITEDVESTRKMEKRSSYHKIYLLY